MLPQYRLDIPSVCWVQLKQEQYMIVTYSILLVYEKYHAWEGVSQAQAEPGTMVNEWVIKLEI